LDDPTQISHFNGKPNISLNINKTKEGNAIALSKEVKEILKEYQKKYPNITLEAYTDTSVWVKNCLNLVSSNILFGLILVFLALFFSVMISILLLSSLFEAFYFLPLHAKEFFSIGKLRKIDEEGGYWKKLIHDYKVFLKRLLLKKKRSLVVLVLSIIVATIGMTKITKFQLFPEFDAQQVYVNGKIDINHDLKETESYVTRIEEKLLKILDKNDVDSVTSVIGFKFNPDASFEIGDNLFQIFVNLHEKAPESFFDKYINPLFSLEYDDSDMIRKRKAQEIVKDIQTKVIDHFKSLKVGEKKLYEEFNVYVQQTGIVSHDIEIGFSADDPKKMLAALKLVEQNLSSIKGVNDISDNANEGERELKLRVNEYGQHLCFTETYVINTLRGAFLKAEYGKMFNEKGLVRIKIEDAYKKKNSDIANFKLTTPEGNQIVRLGDICDFYFQKSFVKIFKEDGTKVRSVFARVDKKVITPAEVMDQIAPLLEKVKKEGVSVLVKGEEKENRKLKKEMMQAAVMAIFLIFITLVWMFNSLILPLIILSTILLSIFGALVGTKLMGIHMTLPGVMGIIGLAGVVVNDGLIMLDFIKGSRNYDVMVEKAGMRLRPIILTSVTTSSLIFFASGQALILQPMAVSLGFGIAWAPILNLFYVPLMYAVIYRVKKDRSGML